MAEYMAYVWLDVHKDTIAAAVAWPGRAEPEYRGITLNRRRSVTKLIHGLQGVHGEALSFAYEAGPCGYGVYREITGTGHDCQVVAPVRQMADGGARSDGIPTGNRAAPLPYGRCVFYIEVDRTRHRPYKAPV